MNYWNEHRWTGWPSPMNYTTREVRGGVHCAGEDCERFLTTANVRNCDNRALCDDCLIRETISTHGLERGARLLARGRAS